MFRSHRVAQSCAAAGVAGILGLATFGVGSSVLDAQEAAARAIECPTALFPELQADPANGAYPDPYVEAACTTDDLVIRSNGIPAFEFQQITPNALQAQDYEWTLPRYAALSDEMRDVPLLGTIAVTLSGLPIFGPNEGAFPDPYGDPVYNDIVDWCLGHTAREGVYHFHALLVSCIADNTARGEPDPVLGYALDGFPIFGPDGCADGDCSDVVTYESGWIRTGDPTTYAWDAHAYVRSDSALVLDQCNGHIGPQGDYHYHATETFPYILGCYRGAEESGAVPPTRLKAKKRSNGRVRLKWRDNADSETGYQIEMAASGDEFEVLTTTSANQRKYMVTGLDAGTEYRFRVRAVADVGTSDPTDTRSVVAK